MQFIKNLLKSDADRKREAIKLQAQETAVAAAQNAVYKEMMELRSDSALDGLITSGQPMLHPDALIQRQGMVVFVNMPIEDDQVSFAWENLNLAVIAPGVEIVPAEGGGDAETDAARFQEASFENCKQTMGMMLRGSMNMTGHGFNIAEPYYDAPIEGGEWAGKRFYKDIVSKGPKYIEFKTNDYSDIEDDGVWQMNYFSDKMGDYTKVPLEDVIYLVHMPLDNSPYGTSLFRPAYPHYIFKKVVLKSWGRFMEHYGVPWPSVAVSEEKFFSLINNTEALSNVQTFLKDNIKRGYSIMPDNMNLGQNSAGSIGERTTAYTEAMQSANRSIARAIWNPALMGEDSTHGTRAATETQTVTQFERFLKFEGEALMAAWNRQAIKPNHLKNFGPNVGCPTMKIKPYSQDDLLIIAQVHKIGQELGLAFDVETLHDKLGTTGEQEGKPFIERAAQPVNLPFGAPPEVEDEELAKRKELTEALFCNLEKLMNGRALPGKSPLYSFPTNGDRRRHPSRDLFAVTDEQIADIEQDADFDRSDANEDADAEQWEITSGQILKEMMETTEDQAGKS